MNAYKREWFQTRPSFLVPKPRLRSVSRHGKPGNFPGKCVPKPGLGNEKKRELSKTIINWRSSAFISG